MKEEFGFMIYQCEVQSLKWKKFVHTIQLICRGENSENTPEFCFISLTATQFFHYFPKTPISQFSLRD